MSKQTITIRRKVDDKILFMKLFALQDELLSDKGYESSVGKEKIRATIQEYIESDQDLVSLIK